MNDLSQKPPEVRHLAALGIEEHEEIIYRSLLANPMLTAEDLTSLIGCSMDRVLELLSASERHGLITHTPDRPRRYIATPPRFAIDALVSQRQADLQRARLAIPDLEDATSNGIDVGDSEKLVEIVTSRATLQQIVTQLHRTAQRERFAFQRLPSSTTHQDEARPGVRVRSVSDLEYLEAPGALDALRMVIDLGEEARAFSTLPVKMFVADRRIGLVLNAGDLEGSVLVVRASPLLDALCALFELIWERATPIAFSREGQFELKQASSIALTEANRKIIPMLAAGFNDKAIAHQAGISTATMHRRVAELMRAFDAQTRFQLGWHAAIDMMGLKEVAD